MRCTTGLSGFMVLLLVACGGDDEPSGGGDSGGVGPDAAAGGSSGAGASGGASGGASVGGGGAGGVGPGGSGGVPTSGGTGGTSGASAGGASDGGPGDPDASAAGAGGAAAGGSAGSAPDASSSTDAGGPDAPAMECAPGERACTGDVPRVCDASGTWLDGATCAAPTSVCLDGSCVECTPGARGCAGSTPRGCDSAGTWVAETPCGGATPTCDAGACIVCKPGAGQCNGQTLQTCDSAQSWVDVKTCDGATPLCSNAGCYAAGSCDSLVATCGTSSDSCCAIGGVEATSFDRSNDPAAPATVSAFALDRYEVTVGRFRQFVGGYPGNAPSAGDGAHPLIAGSGWQAAWDAGLAADQAGLRSSLQCRAGASTWTDAAGAGENLPINCVTWFEAFAFCAWDGGRLATEAEWNAAAAGGDEQREYPWSSPPSSLTIDGTYAAYFCLGDGSNGCKFEDILPVGSRSPAGDGRWGHSDLAGNMWEWALDYLSAPYPTPCADCAETGGGGQRVARGGSYDRKERFLLTSERASFAAGSRSPGIGIRCARDPQ